MKIGHAFKVMATVAGGLALQTARAEDARISNPATDHIMYRGTVCGINSLPTIVDMFGKGFGIQEEWRTVYVVQPDGKFEETAWVGGGYTSTSGTVKMAGGKLQAITDHIDVKDPDRARHDENGNQRGPDFTLSLDVSGALPKDKPLVDGANRRAVEARLAAEEQCKMPKVVLARHTGDMDRPAIIEDHDRLGHWWMQDRDGWRFDFQMDTSTSVANFRFKIEGASLASGVSIEAEGTRGSYYVPEIEVFTRSNPKTGVTETYKVATHKLTRTTPGRKSTGEEEPSPELLGDYQRAITAARLTSLFR